ncbi:MAG: winged helix DNA-binding domain-containing protein, partial [Chloroflexi bacterium]|nr:winged helix DNA-binding domain-containing protein [Chloroflexota bacterium]
FGQTLEAYKPSPIRKWGYFCLPILHKERLVGRFDPKLERRSGVLRLKAIYLEPGIPPDDELVASVAAAMREFMDFHDAASLVIERSEPAEFGDRLLAVL